MTPNDRILNSCPYMIKNSFALFSKADKISKVKMNSHIAAYKKNMFANNWAEMPPYL
jgi:hypothetical protein